MVAERCALGWRRQEEVFLSGVCCFRGSAGAYEPKSQYGELLTRGVRFNDDLWFDIASDPRGRYFYERAHARGLTPSQPYFDEETAAAVSLENVHAALAPDDFAVVFADPDQLSLFSPSTAEMRPVLDTRAVSQ